MQLYTIYTYFFRTMECYRINNQLEDPQISQAIAKVIGYPLQPEGKKNHKCHLATNPVICNRDFPASYTGTLAVQMLQE